MRKRELIVAAVAAVSTALAGLSASAAAAATGGQGPVRPSPTTSAPEVKAWSPTDGNVSTGTSTGPKITAQFRRPMDPMTFTTTSFTLWRPNNTQVPAIPAYTAATYTASITPTLPLSYNTTYTVKLTNAIRSADGAPPASPFSWTFTTTGSMVTKRIDVGATQPYTDGAGREWLKDVNFKNGISESYPDRLISCTSDYDAKLYRDDRYGTNVTALWSSNIPIPNGTYDIKLHFVELTKMGPKQRVFSVDIVDTPGSPALTPYDVSLLDIYDEVGSNTALVRTIPNVTIADSTLTLKSYPTIDMPEIAAIEIIPIHP